MEGHKPQKCQINLYTCALSIRLETAQEFKMEKWAMDIST